MRRFTNASELIGDLLDRFERHVEPRQILGRIDYENFQSISIADQDDCIAQIEALERAGGIELKRQREDGVEKIAHVKLADPSVLYHYLNRRPASQSATAALSPLRERSDPPEIFHAVLDEIHGNWSRNVSWSGLRPGQAQSMNRAVELAVALARQASEPTSSVIDYRSFSRRAVGDSKSLEKLMTPVANLLRRLFPELISDEDLSPEDVFASLGVARLPQPFLASGRFSFEGAEFPDLPYFGTPPEIAHRLTPLPPVSYILTIENYTSFVRHAREINREKNGVALYTGGFPARAILRTIVDIAERSEAPIFHWGDIDPGGLRIFVHVEQALRQRGMSLRPHLMNSELLRSHGRVEDRTARRLQAGKAQTSALAQLWDAMANDPDPSELEQEALEPQTPALE
jgi:Uncharacterized protein conserved in bacteria C-term(DUF2220)